MIHNSLIDLLSAASGQQPATDDDRQLAALAEQYLRSEGWDGHYRLGFASKDRTFAADPVDHTLIVRRKFPPQPERDDVVRPIRVTRSYWEPVGVAYRVESFAGALNQLAVLGITQPIHTTFARDVLLGHADACDAMSHVHMAQSLSALDQRRKGDGQVSAGKSEGWAAAATAAREGMILKKVA